MKIVFDPRPDTLTLISKDGPVAENHELRLGIILEYDANSNLILVEPSERLQASRQATRGEVSNNKEIQE